MSLPPRPCCKNLIASRSWSNKLEPQHWLGQLPGIQRWIPSYQPVVVLLMSCRSACLDLQEVIVGTVIVNVGGHRSQITDHSPVDTTPHHLQNLLWPALKPPSINRWYHPIELLLTPVHSWASFTCRRLPKELSWLRLAGVVVSVERVLGFVCNAAR